VKTVVATIHDKPKARALAIGIPTLGAVHMLWRNRTNALFTPANVNWLEFQVIGRPGADARNYIIQQMLDYDDPRVGRVERIMFIDDDVLLPQDTVLRLWQHDLPIVSGWYVIKSKPIQALIMPDAGGGTLRDVPADGVARCYCAGFGATMIKREVLEKIGAPWTATVAEPRRADHEVTRSVSDDMDFAEKVAKAGIPWHVDYGLHCGHINTHTGEQFWWPGRGPNDPTARDEKV
jgi:hypothetical protein